MTTEVAVSEVTLPEGIIKSGLVYSAKDKESLKQLIAIEDGATVKIGKHWIKVKFSEGTKHYDLASLLSTVEDFATGKVQDVYVRPVFIDKFLSQVKEIKAEPAIPKAVPEEVIPVGEPGMPEAPEAVPEVDTRLLEVAITREPIQVARQKGYEVQRLSAKDIVDKGDYAEGYRFRVLKTVEGKPFPDIFMARNEKDISEFLKRELIPKPPAVEEVKLGGNPMPSANDLIPMSPTEGPPLPRALGIRWPWRTP